MKKYYLYKKTKEERKFYKKQYDYVNRFTYMTHQMIIQEISEMVILIVVMNDMRSHYIKKTNEFDYSKQPLNVTVSYEYLIPLVKKHCKRNGISENTIDKYYRNPKVLQNLLRSLRKTMSSYSVGLETIDNFTCILSYNEYKRSKIRFFRINPIQGMMYNTQKYMDIGKMIKNRIKAIHENDRVDEETFRHELNDFSKSSDIDPDYTGE